MEAGISEHVRGGTRIPSDRSGCNGSLVVSQLWLFLRVDYAAFRGRTAPVLAALFLREFLSRNPQMKIATTATPNIANGITKPITYPYLQKNSADDKNKTSNYRNSHSNNGYTVNFSLRKHRV
jgi:transglutaminase-like putative cysteine protease